MLTKKSTKQEKSNRFCIVWMWWNHDYFETLWPNPHRIAHNATLLFVRRFFRYLIFWIQLSIQLVPLILLLNASYLYRYMSFMHYYCCGLLFSYFIITIYSISKTIYTLISKQQQKKWCTDFCFVVLATLKIVLYDFSFHSLFKKSNRSESKVLMLLNSLYIFFLFVFCYCFTFTPISLLVIFNWILLRLFFLF